jgi:hypothetical protein
MQFGVRLCHFRGNPCAFPVLSGSLTTRDNSLKTSIKRVLEFVLFYGLFQASGNMEPIGEENETRVGGPPKYRIPLSVPGENAHTVSGDESLGREVSPNGEEPIW